VLNRKSIVFLIILLTIVVLLLFYHLTDNGIILFTVFLILWLSLISVTIKPLSRFYYKLIFRRSPTDKQLVNFLIGCFVFVLLLFVFSFLNIKYATTPLNIFLKTITTGSILIAFYYIYKQIKKRKMKLKNPKMVNPKLQKSNESEEKSD
jgi:membrane protease YdiL (CAAX protease family)